ncbi:hypothetical protein HPB50_005282 [Hyalomma asiaticum]|uniref:Uncharacterized protein n=1 Tax=Hyalomma asiaticum TaxID=266040 RepID=A0ACB7T0T4_HYAAI|nr:hypothetical protein HPB50_005282 [Hyalomma asiaticum]
MRAALVPPLLLRPPVVPLLLLLFVLGGRWTATTSLTAQVENDEDDAEREERALHHHYQPDDGTSPPSPEDEPEELLIAGFFPTTLNLSEGAIGRGVVPAVNLALRHINSSPHFLPGYKLDIIWNDTQGIFREVFRPSGLRKPPGRVLRIGKGPAAELLMWASGLPGTSSCTRVICN